MRIVGLLIYFFLPGLILAQQLKFRNFSTEHGLSNNSVNDITSDSYGQIWIATWDGLSVFNGTDFVIYKHHESDPSSLGGNHVYETITDSEGNVWVLTDNSTVSKYLGKGKFKHFTFKNDPENMVLDSNGSLWISTRLGASFYEYKDGLFYATSQKPKISKSKGFPQNELLTKYFNEVTINETLEDSEGNLWYATRNNGLFVINAGTHAPSVSNYTYDPYYKYSPASNEITCLYQDSFGRVWMGYKDGGMGVYSQELELINNIYHHPVFNPKLPDETVRAISKDKEERLWLGYYNSGLYHFNPTKGYFTQRPLKNNHEEWNMIRSLYTATDGTVWVGTYAGVLKINGKKEVFFPYTETPLLPAGRNYSFYEDQTGIWVSCWGGLARFDFTQNKFIGFPGYKELLKLKIRKIYRSGQTLYLATENFGVACFNLHTGKLTYITQKNGLYNNNIYSVLVINPNHLWVSSFGGITFLDLSSGKVHNFSEKEGLPSNLVYSLFSEKENIWFSSSKGVGLINRNTFEIKKFNMENGWTGIECSEGAYLEDQNGNFYFGGNKGLDYFNPSRLYASLKPPNIEITVNKADRSNEYELDYGENDIRFDIETVSFLNTGLASLQYRLKGFEKEWLDYSGQPVSYLNLPSGDFTFEVRSLGWSSNPIKQISLKINKPFYAKTSFILSLLLFGLFLYLIWLNKQRSLAIIRQQKLEQEVKNRTELIQEQKQYLAKANSNLKDKNIEILKQKEILQKLHNRLKDEDFEIEKFKRFVVSEFLKPLTAVYDSLNDEAPAGIPAKKGLISLINNIKAWDYLESTKLLEKKEDTKISLDDLNQYAVGLFSSKLRERDVGFSFNQDSSKEFIHIKLLHYKLLIRYLIHELTKYASKGDFIKLDIKFVKNVLVFSIKSSISLWEENILKLQKYSPYYRSMRILINQLNGKLTQGFSENTVLTELQIPLEAVTGTLSKTESFKWKHARIANELDIEKDTVLVLCKPLNIPIIRQLIDTKKFNLAIEDNPKDLALAVKRISVDLLVVYDEPFNSELDYLIHSEAQKPVEYKTPLIYITEEIDFLMKEAYLESGFDQHIQLPVSKSFLNNQIRKLIDDKKRYKLNKNIRSFNRFKDEENQQNTANYQLINKALIMIDTHLENTSFNVEYLQEKLNISKAKCYRAFKEVLGVSPSDVILKMRLEKAEYLLLHSSLNVSEVGYEVGFQDPKYFSKKFKGYFGKAPTNFKKP